VLLGKFQLVGGSGRIGAMYIIEGRELKRIDEHLS
jgi:hypothetical protein